MNAPERLSEQISYPFPHSVLDSQASQLVRQNLGALAQRYPLFEDCSRMHVVIATFIDQCCPRDPDPRALRLVSHFLYMTLYLNENRTKADIRPLVHGYWKTLRGQNADARHALFSAAQDFRPEFKALVTENSWDPAGFYHYLGLNLAAFCEDCTPNSSQVSPFRYMFRRLNSISALAYFQFWKLVLCVEGEAELRHGVEMFRYEMLSASVQALANDLCCISRDAAENTNNIVLSLQKEHAIGLSEATLQVRGWHDRAVAELAAADAAVEDSRVKRYLEFLRSCAWGNLKSMRLLANRYD